MTIPSSLFVAATSRVRALLYVALLILAAYALATPSTARAADSGFLSAEITATHFFDPLQHNVVDVAGEFADGDAFQANFLQNFNQTGGIERWGYPTSAVFEETPGNLSQYYQRGVIDWQPPPGGGDHTFQRRLAWDYLGGGLGGSIDQGVELHLTNPNPGDLIGPWGHKVANVSVEGDDIGFADFFHQLGGVSSFGYPKTDARRDNHPQAVLHYAPRARLTSRIRQYFQAAVLEYHPESPGIAQSNSACWATPCATAATPAAPGSSTWYSAPRRRWLSALSSNSGWKAAAALMDQPSTTPPSSSNYPCCE